MSRKLTVGFLSMLFLVGAMSLKTAVATHGDGSVVLSIGGAPAPPSPWAKIGGAPAPPSPWAKIGGAPAPPSPWAKIGGAPAPPSPWK